jgi:hypothetical protein
MLKRIMPSPAMAVALVALFVALGSGAYAQVTANSVGTAQLRNRAVTNPKLAHNSVWHAQLGRRVVRNSNLADNSVWHAQLGGGVVRRNNMSAPLLAELGPARTVFAEGATGDGIPPNQDTKLLFEVRGPGASGVRPLVPITTTAGQHTLTVQAVLHVSNTGTAQSDVFCALSLANNPRDFLAGITVGTPPPTNGLPGWSGQITMLGRWSVSAGAHTVTLSCRPDQPPTGNVNVSAGAQMLLIAAP